MVVRSSACRGIAQLMAFVTALGNQIIKSLELRVCRHSQVIRITGDQSNRGAILQGIVLNALLDVRNNRLCAADTQLKRITIRLGLLHKVSGTPAPGTDFVLHIQSLLEFYAEFFF